MYFLFIPSDSMYTLERPVIVNAKNQNDAENMFDIEYGYYPDLPRASYGSLAELVDLHNLASAILSERVDTIGFAHGTDSDEFAFLFDNDLLTG